MAPVRGPLLDAITVKRNMGFENRCTSIVRATGKEFLIAVKSFQDKSEGNE